MATVMIADQPRELRFTWDRLEAAERFMDRSIVEVLSQHTALFKLSELAALCWSAWASEDPALGQTLDKTRALIRQYTADGGTVSTLHAAVIEALVESQLLIRPADAEGTPRPLTAAATAAPDGSAS